MWAGRWIRDPRRVWGRGTAFVAVLVAAALVLGSAAPQGGRLPGRPGSLAPVWSFLGLPQLFSGSGELPATPKQKSGKAQVTAPRELDLAALLKGRKTSGRPPGKAPGELDPYSPHVPQVKPRQSGSRPGDSGFDPKTSTRIESAASSTSDVYQNTDGSYTRKTYTGPVNYKAADGSWKPIDTDLARSGDGRLREKANSSTVDLAANAADPKLAALTTSGGALISYQLQGAAAVTPTVKGATATYAGVLPYTDLVLSSMANGLKETIVLHSRDTATTWTFPLNLRGLTPSMAADGSVEFHDATGAVAARVPHGYMADSKYDPHSGLSAESKAVTYRITTAGGVPALEVSVDAAWVKDPKRVFPIRVDPTIQEYPTASTFADTINPGNNSSRANLEVGTPDGGHEKAYSFLEFANFGARYAGNRITAATLHVFAFWAYNCSGNRFDVNPITQGWSPSGVTSYPGPSFGGSIGWAAPGLPNACANGAGGGYHDPAVGDWIIVSLDPSVFTSWVTGSANYGLALTASQSDSTKWKQFDSLNGPRAPYVDITHLNDHQRPRSLVYTTHNRRDYPRTGEPVISLPCMSPGRVGVVFRWQVTVSARVARHNPGVLNLLAFAAWRPLPLAGIGRAQQL